MRFKSIALAVALVCTAGSAPRPAAAQDPPDTTGLCTARACHIQVEWGVDGPPLTPDRRYGVLGEYLQRTLKHLTDSGQRFSVGENTDVLSLRLRPRVIRAMCDQMAGTSTDMSCQTIGEVQVEVSNPDASVKVPGTIRIRNRCGADQYMDIIRFSEYSAALIAYELSRDSKRKRPAARC
jgi:hypothetical protein